MCSTAEFIHGTRFLNVWYYLLLCLCFHPSLCSLLLPDHHFPQTMLIIPAAPPLLAMTCGAHRAAGRQGLSLCCCWGTQQGRRKSWVLLTCSFSHGLRIPLMFADMSYSVLPHIIQSFMILGPSRPVVCFTSWGGGEPECSCACIKKGFLLLSALVLAQYCLSNAGEGARGVWR